MTWDDIAQTYANLGDTPGEGRGEIGWAGDPEGHRLCADQDAMAEVYANLGSAGMTRLSPLES
jgi:hypothetical protein